MQLVFKRLPNLRNRLPLPFQLGNVIEDHQPVVVIKKLIVVPVLAVLVENIRQLGTAPVDEVARETGALFDILDGMFVAALWSNGEFAVLPPGLVGMPARLTLGTRKALINAGSSHWRLDRKTLQVCMQIRRTAVSHRS